MSSDVAAKRTHRTVVIGMGNPILSDDSIGVRIVADLCRTFGQIPDTTFVQECSIGGLDLLEVIIGFDRVVIVDSIKAQGKPGDWYYFTAEALRPTLNLTNIHDVNFATALALGRCLGMDLAPDNDIHIFAVEIVDGQTFDTRLSPSIEAAYGRILQGIGAKVSELLGFHQGGTPSPWGRQPHCERGALA